MKYKSRKKTSLINKIITVFLALWALIQIFPLYWLVSFSFKDNTEIFQGNMIGLPKVWHFENYRTAFMGGNVGRYLMNSIIVTGVSIAIVVAAALMASYALVRMTWKWRKTTQLIFIMGITVPDRKSVV